MGHLYVGTFFTWLFGADFQASLVAFSFLAIFSFSLLSLVIGKSITGKYLYSICISIFFLGGICTGLVGELFALLDFQQPIHLISNTILSTGNSARFLRGMILPISCILMILGINNANKIFPACFQNYNYLTYSILYGLIAGIAFAWSNDYGVGVWICTLIICLVILCGRENSFKKILFGEFVALLISVVSLVLFVEVITLGHFIEWVKATLSTGGYQSWYYNSEKHFYIYEVNLSFFTIVQGLICIIYLFFLYKNKCSDKAFIRYGIPAFANMVCVCVVNEYHMLSGGECLEVAIVTLGMTIFYELTNFLINTSKQFSVFVIIIAFTLGIYYLVPAINHELRFFSAEKDGVYISNLGGYSRELGADLLLTEEWLDGNKFWATYASGQEVISNIFQPSGTDYIIHVLGDENREKYLSEFKTTDFKEISTIKEDYTIWEYWIRRTNWFFYRELYADYHPVFCNSYARYWERNTEENAFTINENVSIDILKLNDNEYKLVFETNQKHNGIADVYIDYEIENNDFLIYQKMLLVEDLGSYKEYGISDVNYLRDKSKEFIPVNIINGHGELLLKAQPLINGSVKINEAYCNTIFIVPYFN